MAIEAELGFQIPDEDAERESVTTFCQLLIKIAHKRGVI